MANVEPVKTTRPTFDDGSCRLFARADFPPGVLALVWLSSGNSATALRRQVLQQRVGQRVHQEMAGSEVACSRPDELVRDEFEGGPWERPGPGVNVQPHA